VIKLLVEKIKIISYKTIVSEQELDVDPKITMLIGGNETGKTNVLEVMNKFSLNNNFETEDVSRSSNRYRREILPNVGIVFLLSEEDRQKLTTILPIFRDSKKLEIWKKGNGLDTYHIVISEEMISELTREIDDLQKRSVTLSKEVKDANVRAEAIKKQLSSEEEKLAKLPAERKEEAEDRISRLTTQVSEITASIKEKNAELEGYRQELLKTSQIMKRLKNDQLNLTPVESKNVFQVLPKIYFPEEVSYLPEEVPIPSLISQPTKNKNKIVANLLKLGGIDDLKILQAQRRRRSVVLRRAEKLISERLSQIWKQEKIEIQINADEKFLRINLREPVSITAPPEERSEGFRWFLSFYVQFIVDTREQLRNTLILLDDPAVHLHPNGQKDFLVILDEIAENNQVIYTAHSPFLVNKNFPGRVRLLTKEENGTLINNKPYSNGRSRFWEPLRSAIGVSLGDSLFLGGKNLIVEGVSDQIILTGVSHKFATVGKSYIDLEEIAIVPGMGADSLVQIALLATSETLPTMILLDSDKKGDSIVEKLEKKMRQLRKKVSIIRTNEFKAKAKTIEDLIPYGDYLKAVNSAYSRTIDGFKKINEKNFTRKKEPKEVTGSKLKEKEEKNISVVRFIIEEFNKHDYGDFDKVLVAKELVNIIQPKDVEKDEYKHLGELFKNVKEHFKLT